MNSLPLYLVGGGALADRARAAGLETGSVFADAASFLPLSDRVDGLVLVSPGGLPAGDLVELLAACAAAGGAWLPALLVEGEHDDVLVHPLSPAPPQELRSVVRFCLKGEGSGPLPLSRILEGVRRARHDINNPLAAALAETQLLLMDATDPETRQALETIEAQLRRIRDLVASLRLPRPS